MQSGAHNHLANFSWPSLLSLCQLTHPALPVNTTSPIPVLQLRNPRNFAYNSRKEIYFPKISLWKDLALRAL